MSRTTKDSSPLVQCSCAGALGSFISIFLQLSTINPCSPSHWQYITISRDPISLPTIRRLPNIAMENKPPPIQHFSFPWQMIWTFNYQATQLFKTRLAPPLICYVQVYHTDISELSLHYLMQISKVPLISKMSWRALSILVNHFTRPKNNSAEVNFLPVLGTWSEILFNFIVTFYFYPCSN